MSTRATAQVLLYKKGKQEQKQTQPEWYESSVQTHDNERQQKNIRNRYDITRWIVNMIPFKMASWCKSLAFENEFSIVFVLM